MADLVCVLLRHGPYGRIHAAEAVRHALGALSRGRDVSLVLVQEGVYTAVPFQASPASEWTSLSEALTDPLVEDTKQFSLFVEEQSLKDHGLDLQNLLPGVKLATAGDVADLIGRAHTVFVF